MNYRRTFAIYRKLGHFSKHYVYYCAAKKLQLNWKLYLQRKLYWGHRKIKQFIWNCRETKIVHTRKVREQLRMQDEEIVYKAIVVRANKFLTDKLEEEEGADLLKNYLIEVDAAVRREGTRINNNNTIPVFPNKYDDPHIATLYTTRAKAMYVLNKRSELDVIRLSREKFRKSSPPIYYCDYCLETFLTGERSRLHYQLGCPHKKGIHICQSWAMAKTITEIALQRLMVNFFSAKKTAEKFKERNILEDAM